MATYVPPKKNTAFITYVSLPSRATPGIFQANPTLAAGDVKVAIDDGAPANMATLPAVDADFTKRVKVSLSAAEMNGDNISIIFADAAGAEWGDVTINIHTAAQQVDDLATQASVNTIDDFLDTEIAAILADTNELQTDWANGGRLDLLIDAIKAKTDGLPSDPADQSGLEALIDALPTAAENATQLLDVAAGVETGLTVRQALRLMAAVLYGKASGMETTTAVFRDIGDTKNRIQATVDSSGNRTSVTRDAT